MTIVSDTTPIRYLVEIGEVHVLEALFGGVIIPQAVCAELQGTRTPQQVRMWIQAPPPWLAVKSADISLFTPKAKIEDGEREAIALALEMQADALLCDDGKAIKEANRVNLPVLRLFNILQIAADNDLLDLPDAIDRVRQTTFRMPSDEIVNAMLERDRLRKQAS
jgi:predicted nucleic acid-binding protein